MEFAGLTVEAERSSNLRDACTAFMAAAALTGNDKNDTAFREKINSRIGEIDRSLSGSSHCPPHSGATIQLHWEPS